MGFYKTDRLRENYFEVRGPCKYNWRKMTSKDVPKVTTTLKEYVKDFKLSVDIDTTYVKQWLLPIHTYVNDESNDVIPFMMFLMIELMVKELSNRFINFI